MKQDVHTDADDLGASQTIDVDFTLRPAGLGTSSITLSIKYVMKNGELFEGDMLDQMWPQQKKLELLWDTDPAPLKTPSTHSR